MAVETKKNLVGGLAGVPASQLKERKKEDDAWKKKLFGYLEGYKKSFESLTSGKKVKGEGLFSKLFGGLKGLFGGGIRGLMGKILGMIGLGGIFAKVAGLGLGAAMLPAAVIIWGLTAAFNVIQDWIKGYKEGGLSGAIATALGGQKEGGIWNSVVQASKWGGIGALAGLATFGPVGAIVGGLLGLALGAIFGWLGSEKIQTWIDKIFGLPEGQLLTEAELAQVEKDKAAMTASIAETTKELTAIQAEMKAIENAVAARGFMYDEERIKLEALTTAEAAAILKLAAERKARAALNTKTQEHWLEVTKENQAQVDDQIEATGETWTNLENNIIALKEELIALERIGGLTDAERKFRLDQIAALEAQVKIQQDIKNELRDEEKVLEKKAQEQMRELAYEKGMGAGLWLDTKLFFKNLWQGTFLPTWLSQPVDEWLPLWMRQPLAITLQHDLPQGIGNLWKAIGNFWEGKDSDGNPLFGMPAWMTTPIGELWSTSALGNWFKNNIYDPGGADTGPGGMGGGTPMRIFGIELKWPTIDVNWKAIPHWFKNNIYDPGEGDAPMKIFGAEIKFPELNWNADDIWNALPLWIRNPVQFIKDNLPDFGQAAREAAEKAKKEILDPVVDTAKDVYEFDVMPGQGQFSVKSGTDAVVTGAGKVASGVQSAWNMASDFVTGGDKKDDAPAKVQRSGPSQRTVSRAPPIQKDLHSKVAVSNANMAGVDWAKLGGRDTVEGIILSIWNDLGIKGAPTFTSGIRPKGHPLYRKGSQHSIGAAFDLRSKDISPELAGEAWSRLKSAFGALGLWGQWETGDVNKEGRTGEHFHFQLKRVADAIGNSEPHMKTDLGLMLKAHPSAMGALLRGFGGGGGGTTTVNNVTVAPQTSTSVASTNIAENVYGTVDPYTNASGAYG